MSGLLGEHDLTSLDTIKRSCSVVGGCWLWNGAQASGYAQVRFSGKRVLVHRLTYVMKYGFPVSDKATFFHHSCGIKECVNPDHIEPVDARTHSLIHPRGRGWTKTELDLLSGKRKT